MVVLKLSAILPMSADRYGLKYCVKKEDELVI